MKSSLAHVNDLLNRKRSGGKKDMDMQCIFVVMAHLTKKKKKKGEKITPRRRIIMGGYTHIIVSSK